jgi:hypothetical protein
VAKRPGRVKRRPYLSGIAKRREKPWSRGELVSMSESTPGEMKEQTVRMRREVKKSVDMQRRRAGGR